ncbi:MAG: flagellar assembly protein FliW [Nitrospiraceae bacterium]|nr:MAG: flagellar assembly protein FliW [Nitrospiraceae bacterium]
MNVASTRFGTLSVPAETLLTFPSGLLGFSEWTRYVMLDHDTDAPFKWLHCVEEASLAFVVIDPALFNPSYQITISSEARFEVGGNETDELSLVVILTIPSDDPSAVTANLRGPLLMNPRTRLCKQLVLTEDYPTRYPVFSAHVHTQRSQIPALAEAIPA